MENYPVINKKMVKKNRYLRRIRKQSKKNYPNRGSKAVTRSYFGKLIRLMDDQLLGEEKRVTLTQENDLLTANQIIEKVEKENLTGMSGNGFPTATKLFTFLSSNEGNRCLLVNAVECEPGLLHDEWLLEHRWEFIKSAIQMLLKEFHIQQVILATKKATMKALPDQTSEKVVSVRYPMGEEHILIQELLGKFIPQSQIPAEQGILILNVQTIYQIYKIVTNQYDGGRFITLANMSTGEARVAYVDRKEELQPLLETCFQRTLPTGTIYAGGGLLYAHKIQEKEVLQDTVTFAAIVENTGIEENNPCKKCGACNRKCPSQIDIKSFVQAYEQKQAEKMNLEELDECIQCGSCTYVCHARKNVVKLIQNMKIRKTVKG